MAFTGRGHSAEEDFDTLVARVAQGGLNLSKDIDALETTEVTRMSNMVRTLGGPLQTRLGETSLATTAATHIHSIGRLNIPSSSTFARFAGGDTSLYKGTSGALGAAVDTSYSGDPLTMLPYRPALSGQPWMFVADRSRMRKISSAGTVRTIGIAPPAAVATTALDTEKTTSICKFEAADSTQAASWTLTAGTGGTPTAGNDSGGVIFGCVVGAATEGYYSTVSIAKAIDLSLVGATAATDDDIIRFLLSVNRQDWLEEIRVYFVCSAVFTAGTIPGTSSTLNTDAWWKSFRPNEITELIENVVAPYTVENDIRDERLRQEFLDDRLLENDRTSAANINALGQVDPSRLTGDQLAAGRSATTTFGSVGYPLRRGDFYRIGTTSGRGWNNITGIVIVLRTSTNQALLAQFDEMVLAGGAGPDSIEPTSQPYDYRYTHYDPDTGAESNPAPTMAEANWLDATRRGIVVTPTAQGTATFRQRIYRRGGTLTDDWYFVGTNSADGGAFTDTLTDAAIAAAGSVYTDHAQAVTTVDSAGVTVLAQALPSLWGPMEDLLFACGDPYRPGHIYWCKPGEPDHWPAANNVEVCAPAEELMAGGVYASSAFVFSRERMFQLLPNVVNGGGVVAAPTACGEGLVSRWGLAVGRGGIYFVARDGIRVTTGGTSQLISDAIAPLFDGVTKHGTLPIDFTTPTAIKLSIHDDDLWFIYRDSGGTRRSLIYNLEEKVWRPYTFFRIPSCAFSEPNNAGGMQLLLGGLTTGAIYTHSGFTDDGTAIACSFRTGAWDFGHPREDKRLGDIVVDMDAAGTQTITLQSYLNNEVTTNTAQTVTGVSGRRRYMFDAFGTDPQAARNVSFDLSFTAPTGATPSVSFLGCSARRDPDTLMKRATQWDELPGGEGYLTGVRLITDTGNTAIDIEVEYTTSTGSVTSAATLAATANGRRILHFTWTAVYAQQVRLRPTGSCESWKLYKLEWITQSEPPRIAGWNSNWSDYGIMTDKKLKGFVIHCDTFNVAKTWVLDRDGSSAVQTGSITQNGPGIQFITFAQETGRLFRFRSTDANVGKLYKIQPIFDVEPFKLTRWETQEQDHGYVGWQIPLEGIFTLNSSAEVTLTMIVYNQTGGTINTRTYAISSTSSTKAPRYVQFNPDKGCLFKYTLTSASPFWLYREESSVTIQPFGGGNSFKSKPFGNDDLDRTRGMTVAENAAARSGGTLDA